MITQIFLLGSIGVLLKVLVVVALLGMYLYAKLSPHKDRLDPKHRGWYDTADKIFGGMSRALGGGSKPYQVGDGIFLDMGQLYLYAIIAAIALALMMGL